MREGASLDSTESAPPGLEDFPAETDAMQRSALKIALLFVVPGLARTVVAAGHADVIAKMRTAYDAWWAEVRPLMVNEDVPLAPERPFFVLYEKQHAGGGIPAWKAPKLD